MRRALRQWWTRVLKSWTRMTSFIGKEITEVLRRPGALMSLVLGPFLIMGLFGVGYGGQRRPLETVIVIPQGSNLPSEAAFYQPLVGESVNIVEITPDVESARERLRRREIDLAVIAPPNIEQQFLEGRQSAIAIEYNQVDPILDNYARFVAYRQVQELNRVIIERAVREGEQYAVQQLGGQPSQIPPGVVAAPTRAETRNLAPLQPSVVAFYTPAVLALILQHMAVTLTALSMVRERTSGVMDIFRVAPVRTLEILVGKYLAYGFLNLAVATLVTMLVVVGLGVPMLGDPKQLAAIIIMLTVASLGLGLLISMLVDSDRQAVQLAMLLLLASVFFSGFVLPLDEFLPAVQWFAYLLPVTHGIQLLQDTMLQGGTYLVWQYWALVAIAAVVFLFTAVALRRSLQSA